MAAGSLVVFRTDEFHTKERRAAMQTILADISADTAGGEKPHAPGDGEWMDERLIECSDGAWLAYRARCQKVDRKIHDIFIARASDGRWYYSTYHFCIHMMVLAGNGQPASLEDFIREYSLKEFDGRSDIALMPTWPAGQ